MKILKAVKTILWDVPIGIAVAPVVVPAIMVVNAITVGATIKAVTAQEDSNNETEN